MPEKVRCVRITRPDTHGSQDCINRLEHFYIADEFAGAELGESITLTLCEMTAEEYDALPEFEGW